LAAAIVADVGDPAVHQSALAKWRSGSSPDLVRDAAELSGFGAIPE
jgi:hypothetical protein